MGTIKPKENTFFLLYWNNVYEIKEGDDWVNSMIYYKNQLDKHCERNDLEEDEAYMIGYDLHSVLMEHEEYFRRAYKPIIKNVVTAKSFKPKEYYNKIDNDLEF